MLLEVKDLTVSYKTIYGRLEALNKINLSISAGESTAIVGESGSGKSTLGLSIVRLLAPNSSYDNGSIFLDGKDIVKMNRREVVRMRGKDAFMVFQDPLNSLNPVKRVKIQLLEAIKMRTLRQGKQFDERQAFNEALETLREVRLPDPELIIERFPHQLSGGQIQRVVIAFGLIMRPKLLIADEPTSALDVTIQAQVLKLMNDLKRDYDMSILFITHDISVAYAVSDRVVVMYAGEISEKGPTEKVVKSPLHPYAQGLISSIPKASKKSGNLQSIVGAPPNMLNPPIGCRFNPRCSRVMEICRKENPRETEQDERIVRCFLYG